MTGAGRGPGVRPVNTGPACPDNEVNYGNGIYATGSLSGLILKNNVKAHGTLPVVNLNLPDSLPFQWQLLNADNPAVTGGRIGALQKIYEDVAEVIPSDSLNRPLNVLIHAQSEFSLGKNKVNLLATYFLQRIFLTIKQSPKDL